jgi:hypothetical protein
VGSVRSWLPGVAQELTRTASMSRTASRPGIRPELVWRVEDFMVADVAETGWRLRVPAAIAAWGACLFHHPETGGKVTRILPGETGWSGKSAPMAAPNRQAGHMSPP